MPNPDRRAEPAPPPPDPRIPRGGPLLPVEETTNVIEPKIDELLKSVDSRYTLVILAAKRAREINSYYSQLGE